ncbi:PREDICTED: uncharacterized protein LOC109229819 [Nicotiana attenuata]|uniref:Uncharacterized protein n=1 Tax=Nicotiana attenuata TaxID=49451 RepID=A0A1J6IY68_NICAT|nr:PREDICTED: uncharacterized protein LOC109229819 [Nicotiana attenuata]OIT00065.1 hypothetical protein A4A49_28194 [Nicotiana attenuata]
MSPVLFYLAGVFAASLLSLGVIKAMGRGRGKGKKLSLIDPNDPGSDEEENIPTQKRRGRPQKSFKDDIEEEATEMIDEENSENEKNGIANLEIKNSATGNGKKRNRNTLIKEKRDSVKEENDNGTRSGNDESTRSNNGFRHRRKNKPRRAAEAGFKCN